MAEVASAVERCRRTPNVLVGVDGASGSGKSTFADEVADALRAAGRTVVRASIDSFHRPRHERYRRGADSPEGYYDDSHDLSAVRRRLLVPFRDGSGSYVTAVFDEPSDRPVDAEPMACPVGAILVFDGLFLHRPELVPYWDLSVFLVADRRRETQWDAYLHRDLPGDEAARRAEITARRARARLHRYREGQALYERIAEPRTRAHLVIDNDDLEHPRLLRG